MTHHCSSAQCRHPIGIAANNKYRVSKNEFRQYQRDKGPTGRRSIPLAMMDALDPEGRLATSIFFIAADAVNH
jgi:hypothetical protein